MADNFSVTPGSGVDIRAVEKSAKKAQTITVDIGGAGVEKLLTAGRQADADSVPAALSTEDVAILGATNETAPANDTATSGLNGRLQRIAQNLTSYLGENSGAAVVTDANGTIQQYLRGLIKFFADALGAGTAAAAHRTTLASDDPAVSVLGATNGAKVITDANGTIQQYLRGLVSLAITALKVGGNTIVQAASSTITRPADTTAYASGDLVANSTTAGSVANLQFTTAARVSGGSGVIVGAEIQKSTVSITNAAFRLHLFDTAPTYTSAGDNSPISTVVQASGKGYLGYIDIPAMIAFSDVAWGSGSPDNSRSGIPFVASAQTIYGLLEARGAYTPGNAEVFTVKINAYQD